MTDVQNTVFFSKNININMNLFDDVTDQNDFIEKMKLKLTIIKIEKIHVHLRHKLIQMKTKKTIDFFVTVFVKITLLATYRVTHRSHKRIIDTVK